LPRLCRNSRGVCERGLAVHYPDHLRAAFYDWIEKGCLPLARVEVGHGSQVWPAERLLRKMVGCSDVTPDDFYWKVVHEFGAECSRRQTCGSVALALLNK
jgi:hypothetical protein